MVATFDGLKDQIKSIASSPVSPTHVTADGRAGDPFLALNQFCTCVYVLYVSDHSELDFAFGEIMHLYMFFLFLSFVVCSPIAHNLQIGWPCLVKQDARWNVLNALLGKPHTDAALGSVSLSPAL